MGQNFDKFIISKDRFLELSVNPTRNRYDKKSVNEVKGGLLLEAMQVLKNLRRPTNPLIDLDFEAEFCDSGETIFLDHKQMIDHAYLADLGRDISKLPPHKKVAYDMAVKSVAQKSRCVGMDKGPKSPDEVYHVFNFSEIRNRDEVAGLIQAVNDGNKSKGYTGTSFFINYD